MNKCIFYSKTDVVSYYKLKNLATECNVDLVAKFSIVDVLSERYYEKCPILVGTMSEYNQLFGSLSPITCQDIYAISGEKIVGENEKFETIKDFFSSKIFKQLSQKMDRQQSYDFVRNYLSNIDSMYSDWRMEYILQIICEMYYFDTQTVTTQMLEYVLKKNRFQVENVYDCVRPKLKYVLEKATGQKVDDEVSIVELFKMFYNEIFK